MMYKKIPIAIYNRDLYVTNDEATAIKLAKKLGNRMLTGEDILNCNGFALNCGFSHLVYVHKAESYKTVAHEATHVALDIFMDSGAIVDTGNQEPLAYLIGYLSGEMSRWLYK